MNNIKPINEKSKNILNEIIFNIVPIKPLNIRTFKPIHMEHYIQVEIQDFFDQGNIIYLSKIIRNKNVEKHINVLIL